MSKLQQFLQSLQNKKIIVQGLGLNGGGVGTSLFFLENGLPITITDLKTKEELQDSVDQLSKYSNLITYVLGEHRESDFVEADIVVKGPGVRPTNKFIQLALQNGASVISDIEIFASIVDCPLYAVTGSKGKSSTVSCIYQIFKSCQPENAFLGGNITISPLSFYKQVDEDSLVILELSSWQLRDLHNRGVRFHGVAFTNLMHDHQNYYNGMEDYLADKMVITENQQEDDFIVLPKNDDYVGFDKIQCEATKFCFDTSNQDCDIHFVSEENDYRFDDVSLFTASDVNVIGKHNIGNIMLAAGFCYCAGIEPSVIKNGVQNFKGAAFRLEKIATINGVTFINDTTATIPEAAVSAISSLDNVIWIGGGNDKNLDYTCIAKIASKPKKIYLLPGDGTEKIISFLGGRDYVIDNSLENLVNMAFANSQSGDYIVLSPGATSFGSFANEFDRGRRFNNAVQSLVEKEKNG